MGELPRGWRRSTVGEVVELQRGYDITRAEQRPGHVPVVSSGGISSFHDSAAVVGPGVVIGRKGTLGTAFFIDEPYWPHDTTLWVRDFKGNEPRYIYYWLKSLRLEQFNVGSANPTLNRNHVHPMPCLLPPPAEQRAIVGVLGALDDKIDSNRRIARLLEDEARAVFEDQFDTNPQESGTPLRELIAVNPPRQLRPGTLGTYVGMADLPTDSALVERWDLRQAGSGQRFINGDVLLARITPCLENGKTALVDFLAEDEIGWGSTEYIVFAPKDETSTAWIYCLARSEPFVEFAVRNMTGSSGRQRCPATAFDQYCIFNPDRQLLRDFGARFESSFRRMGMARDESRVLARLRDALLPEMLSGRLRVRDAEGVLEGAV